MSEGVCYAGLHDSLCQGCGPDDCPYLSGPENSGEEKK